MLHQRLLQPGVTPHERARPESLVVRCYPRKLAFAEDDSPFALEPRGWLMAGVATAIVMLVSWMIEDVVTALALFGALGLGLLLAHRTRTVRIHVTRLHQFLIYESDPTRPIGIGPVSDLQMDVHAYPGNHSVRCKWLRARGPKWESTQRFELESLPRADWLTVQRFIAKHGLRGL
jgi:hypothetical protein